MKRDISPIIGIGLAFGAVLFGYIYEGGNPASLLQPSAFIIVVGGTIGAVITSFSVKDFVGMGKGFGLAMSEAKGPSMELAEAIVNLAEKARKEGLLSLEDYIEDIDDNLLKKGMRLVIDGVDPEEIEEIMYAEVDYYEHTMKERAEIFFQMGGFLPTLGIVGTVTGLVLVLSHLGGDAAALGESIAVAFVATLYGIAVANLIALPISNKLKKIMKEEKMRMEMVITGIFAIHKGESPMLVEEKMSTYMGGKKLVRKED